jgi:hypothetical protein
MKNRRKRLFLGIGLFFLAIALLTCLSPRFASKIDPREKLPLEQHIELATEIARDKVTYTIEALNQSHPLTATDYFPYITRQEPPWREKFWKNFIKRQTMPHKGEWIYKGAKNWPSGAFPGILWKLSALETDPAKQAVWIAQAKAWSEPMRSQIPTKEDMTLNNWAVFQPWYEHSQGQERQQQLDALNDGAKILATPYRQGTGNFHEAIGTMGFVYPARQDRKSHWQAFIDHSINVEQLLWAAAHSSNTSEAQDWKTKAIRHIKTLAAHFEHNVDPSSHLEQIRTGQRSFFEDNAQSPHYGKFLFSEGKQGWHDRSVWSRGQAWFIYAASVTYAYSQDSEVLAIAKQSINYFLAHLPDRFPGARRRPGDFIALWDFDYALQKDPDTERDSSAAAIAVDGIIRLLKVLPSHDVDRARYLKEAQNILYQLTSSDYLPNKDSPEQSILRHGCYHHPQALKPGKGIEDNGLIWGDYFFLDAIVNYRKLN